MIPHQELPVRSAFRSGFNALRRGQNLQRLDRPTALPAVSVILLNNAENSSAEVSDHHGEDERKQ